MVPTVRVSCSNHACVLFVMFFFIVIAAVSAQGVLCVHLCMVIFFGYFKESAVKIAKKTIFSELNVCLVRFVLEILMYKLYHFWPCAL